MEGNFAKIFLGIDILGGWAAPWSCEWALEDMRKRIVERGFLHWVGGRNKALPRAKNL